MNNTVNFKALLGHYASGLTVISTVLAGKPVGFTCQSFHSVSMDPPLVSFNVMRTSTSWPAVRGQGRFSINVLSHKQISVSNALARSGPEKWDSIAWSPTPAGNPMLDDCLVWMDCEFFDEHEAGDHTIVLARVVGTQKIDTIPALPPLVYFKGQYCSIAVQAE